MKEDKMTNKVWGSRDKEEKLMHESKKKKMEEDEVCKMIKRDVDKCQ